MHRTLLCTFVALALGVGVAGLAWACTPQAYISLSQTSVAEEGSTVTVTGRGFIPGPVQIRLDSGSKLATATGPDFAIDVKIPKAKPGVYYVRAVAYESNGTVAGGATRALEVIPTAAPKASEPVPISEPARAPARERPRAAAERSPASEPRATPAASEPAAAQAPAAQAPAEGDAGATAKAPAQSAQADMPARTKSPPKAKGASEPAAPQPVAIAPLASSVSSLWSGQAATRPGLESAPASAKPSSGIPSLGVGLLVLGLAVLGGAGFALIRARPLPSAPEASTIALPVAELGPPSLEEELEAVIEPGLPSLEEELEELITESVARRELDPAASEDPAPREPAGAAC